MKKAKRGDIVTFHFTCRSENEFVSSTHEMGPKQLQLGRGHTIPRIERALEGLTPGEQVSVRLAPAEGYGERDPQKVVDVPRAKLNLPDEPKVGDRLGFRAPTGEVISAVINFVSASTVTIDTNHPLAGKPVQFDLQLVAIL